jgi:hypothetical protein
MNREEAQQARAILLEADHTGRLLDLEIVDFYRPETAPVESPVYIILARFTDGECRHITDFDEALAFAAKLRVRKQARRRGSGQ